MNEPFFCPRATWWPAIAASWAADGGTPGGAGGMTGWAKPSNLAPPSKPFWNERRECILGCWCVD